MRFVSELKSLGLSDGEARVYVALMGLGISTVGVIVKRSGVAYSNIYDVLNRLIDKGLASFVVEKKMKHYQALKPSRLKDYLKEKESEIKIQRKTLEKMSKDIEAFSNFEGEQKAQVFVGMKGLLSAYEKLRLSKTKELLFLVTYNASHAKQSDLFYEGNPEFWNKYPIKGISNNEFKKSKVYKENKKILNMKFVDFPIPANIDIAPEQILIVSWGEPLISILIDSKNVAESFRKYFMKIWKEKK